ncbi:hypothetical protein RCL_jg28392.t1 [Rhizophagus clarus]|uniref:Uncharacterized protein n=1 Tax=Rhizophagus clarus TaxID=94130 RepID=A0A8H3M8J7_9GLOM|nr:hypothetical protein RCL_jg28392.t1 [Rhizophagus clarus]
MNWKELELKDFYALFSLDLSNGQIPLSQNPCWSVTICLPDLSFMQRRFNNQSPRRQRLKVPYLPINKMIQVLGLNSRSQKDFTLG